MSMQRLIVEACDRLARVIGLRVIPTWKLDRHFLTTRLRRVFNEYQIDCVIDVGANIGQYRDYLRDQVGYRGLIISFEPDPDSYRRLLQRQPEDDLWQVYGTALGKSPESIRFNIMKSSVFNSFLEPDNSEPTLLSDGNSVVKTIDVDVKRLDNVLEDLRARLHFRNVFLKIDTQGFDLEVFEGASGCLNSIKGVQSEISVMPIYKGMPSFEASLRAFRSKGFEVSGLYSLSEDRFPYAIEFDCIYLPKR